jgi:hypothetical protein
LKLEALNFENFPQRFVGDMMTGWLRILGMVAEFEVTVTAVPNPRPGIVIS